MNTIQLPWKSKNEFVRKTLYSEAELKKFGQAIPRTQNLIRKKKTEFNKLLRNYHSLYNTPFNNDRIVRGVIADCASAEVMVTEDKDFNFEKFLLTGPEMTDEQFEFVQEKRKHFNEWK